jgi:hypothetical protein
MQNIEIAGNEADAAVFAGLCPDLIGKRIPEIDRFCRGVVTGSASRRALKPRLEFACLVSCLRVVANKWSRC